MKKATPLFVCVLCSFFLLDLCGFFKYAFIWSQYILILEVFPPVCLLILWCFETYALLFVSNVLSLFFLIWFILIAWMLKSLFPYQDEIYMNLYFVLGFPSVLYFFILYFATVKTMFPSPHLIQPHSYLSHLFSIFPLQIFSPNTPSHASILVLSSATKGFSQARWFPGIYSQSHTHSRPLVSQSGVHSAFFVASQGLGSLVHDSAPPCSKHGAKCINAFLIGRFTLPLWEGSLSALELLRMALVAVTVDCTACFCSPLSCCQASFAEEGFFYSMSSLVGVPMTPHPSTSSFHPHG